MPPGCWGKLGTNLSGTSPKIKPRIHLEIEWYFAAEILILDSFSEINSGCSPYSAPSSAPAPAGDRPENESQNHSSQNRYQDRVNCAALASSAQRTHDPAANDRTGDPQQNVGN